MGIRTKLNGYPAETLGGLTTACRRWRWPTPTPRSPPAATATARPRSRKSRSPTASPSCPALQGQAHQGVRGRRDRRGDADPQGEHPVGGTGTKANIGCPAAGKTGTTDEFTDAWFVGFTPRLSTAVWVGYPNGAGPDDDPVPRRLGGRRHVPGRDLGRLHEAGQGQVLRRLHAAQDAVPEPRRSSAGTPAAAAAAPATDRRRRRRSPPAPTTPAPRTRRATSRQAGQRRGGAAATATSGEKGFDPDKYESPPQGRTGRAAEPGGGAAGAPG